LTEIGKVKTPETSGVVTISLIISLQLRQTPPHETTFFLKGHPFSDSILIKTSLNSSSGI
jgi:hypothetical protein